MIAQEKPAPDGNRETGYDAAFNRRNLTAIRGGSKALIVRLALWGLIPAALATWLIQRGGLKDD